MNERCPIPTLQILQRPPDVGEPCLIEEIEVAVRPARVNQAGSRIDKGLKVQRVIPSDGAISGGSHGTHYIPFTSQFRLASQFQAMVWQEAICLV